MTSNCLTTTTTVQRVRCKRASPTTSTRRVIDDSNCTTSLVRHGSHCSNEETRRPAYESRSCCVQAWRCPQRHRPLKRPDHRFAFQPRQIFKRGGEDVVTWSALQTWHFHLIAIQRHQSLHYTHTHTYTHTHFTVAILSSPYSPNVHTLFIFLFSLLNVSFQIHSICFSVFLINASIVLLMTKFLYFFFFFASKFFIIKQ